MRKIFKNMAWTMAATLVMAACSDSLDESDSTGQGLLTGEGYVKVAINMPTTNGSMTRVDDGSILDDGLENEYKVNSGIIAFFKAGSTESNPDANATFVKAYALNSLTQQDDNTDPQVSTRVTTTTEAPLVGDSEQLYALVILNPNTSVVSVTSSGVLTVGTTQLNSTSKLDALQSKLSVQTLTNYTGEQNNAFLMTNAPLSTLPGNNLTSNTATAKILVPVTVHETKAAAEGDTDPARIYVERVVAKVTLSGFNYSNNEYTKVATVTTSKPSGDTESVYNGDIIQLQGWVLTVTNKSTKLVRDVSDFSSWLTTDNSNNASRFVGTNTIAMADNQRYYRIYWAEDGNYDKAGTTPTTDFTTYTTDDITTNIPWNEDAEHGTSSSPLYCLENTMNYGEQIENRTTSVLLKTEYRVKFHKDDTPDARDFYICGTSPTKYPKESITISGEPGTTIQSIVEYVQNTASVTDLALQENADGGIYKGADGMKRLFKKIPSGDLTDQEATQIWNAVGPIKYYKGGVSYYYAALIRHFNDSEAKWEADEAYALKHLGRYGVVRNNWYDITINSISGPGDPAIVPPSGNPDDNAEGYIRAEINVLSWAKRSQGVDL